MTPLSPERIAELRAEIEHRRSIACEGIGPLPLDEVEALLNAADTLHRQAPWPHYGGTL